MAVLGRSRIGEDVAAPFQGFFGRQIASKTQAFSLG
jgi:hypothetical protein